MASPATLVMSGNVTPWSQNPPGLSVATGTNTPTGNIGDRPYSAGDGNYARAFNVQDADAIAGLASVGTSGPFQDINAILAAISGNFGAQAVGGVTQSNANGHLNAVLAPRALLMALRDQINFMLANSPVPR